MADAIKEVAGISMWVDKTPHKQHFDDPDPRFRHLCQCDAYEGKERCKGDPTYSVHFDSNEDYSGFSERLCEKHINQLRAYAVDNLRVPADSGLDDGKWHPIETLEIKPSLAGSFDLWVEHENGPQSAETVSKYRVVDCGIDEDEYFYHFDDDGEKWVIGRKDVTHWMRVGPPKEKS